MSTALYPFPKEALKHLYFDRGGEMAEVVPHWKERHAEGRRFKSLWGP